MVRTTAIEKILSKNDTGETGGHQAGILIPKKEEILSFFPVLGIETKNPRCLMHFRDSIGRTWKFSFIYYNNKLFGGTRNEYRLTGMTEFLRVHNLKAGDTITLRANRDESYSIEYRRENKPENNKSRLKLGNSWKVVKL